MILFYVSRLRRECVSMLSGYSQLVYPSPVCLSVCLSSYVIRYGYQAGGCSSCRSIYIQLARYHPFSLSLSLSLYQGAGKREVLQAKDVLLGQLAGYAGPGSQIMFLSYRYQLMLVYPLCPSLSVSVQLARYIISFSSGNVMALFSQISPLSLSSVSVSVRLFLTKLLMLHLLHLARYVISYSLQASSMVGRVVEKA